MWSDLMDSHASRHTHGPLWNVLVERWFCYKIGCLVCLFPLVTAARSNAVVWSTPLSCKCWGCSCSLHSLLVTPLFQWFSWCLRFMGGNITCYSFAKGLLVHSWQRELGHFLSDLKKMAKRKRNIIFWYFCVCNMHFQRHYLACRKSVCLDKAPNTFHN